MSRALIFVAACALAACSSPANNDADAGATNNTMADMGSGGSDTGNTNSMPDMASSDDMGTGGDPVVVIENAGSCYDFSDDPDIPLAIDGAFTAETPQWRRPFDDEMCPAGMLLPDTAAYVPYVAATFCNTDTVDHVYDFEFVAQEGPDGEPPLDDPYLVLYDGEVMPDDYRQCLAANDDIENALDSKDAEILGLTVPAGGAVTVIGTTYTFEEATNTGTGGFIMIVSNAD